jgi:transcriptional regulator with XRE-family HTH domain
MAIDRKPQILGTYIRARRLSRELTLADAAARSGLHVSYWSKLETGHYKSPSPQNLQTIARVIDVRYEDLYGLAGYDTPERLPSFAPYLRTKYELPPEAVAELERYFDLLRNFYDIPTDQPVFPPKPKDNEQPNPTKSKETPDRRMT